MYGDLEFHRYKYQLFEIWAWYLKGAAEIAFMNNEKTKNVSLIEWS